MAGAGNNARTERRAGHSLCPLESYREGEICLHAMHMALRMEDGMKGDALNVQAGCRQWMENPVVVREGCRRLANRLESHRQTRNRWGGKFK